MTSIVLCITQWHGRRLRPEFRGAEKNYRTKFTNDPFRKKIWFNTEKFLTTCLKYNNNLQFTLFDQELWFSPPRIPGDLIFSTLILCLTSNNSTCWKIERYFSKYWGRNHRPSPTSNFGNPPVPLGLGPCTVHVKNVYWYFILTYRQCLYESMNKIIKSSIIYYLANAPWRNKYF